MTAILSKEEVKKAIHFQNPLRPPVADGLPFSCEFSDECHLLKSKYRDDVLNENITVGYFDAPADDPEYRFAMSVSEVSKQIARDNHPVISSWDQLDCFFKEFPGYFYQPSYDRVARLREAYPFQYLKVSFGHYLFWRLAELRGLQNFLVDLYENEDKLILVMDRLLDLYAMWSEKMKKAGADGIHGGEDIGTQLALFCNPTQFREIFKTPYRKLGEIIHGNGLDYWLHSCGNITDIMGDLIDCKVDVIHPIQVGAMNSEEIFKKYQGKICFHVGMDVQFLIPFEKEEVIYEEVKKRMRLFYSKSGGAIYGAGNVLTKEIPLSKIEAYRRAMADFIEETSN
ncbi:MAG: hypothetical protein JXQ23_04270 [Clostridia bacterium]|nr:hypothetical protein [Clostridia bacterium]